MNALTTPGLEKSQKHFCDPDQWVQLEVQYKDNTMYSTNGQVAPPAW